MRLVAVQIGEEHDAGFIRMCWALEDVTRQRHRGRERRVIGGLVAAVERLERRGGRGRDRVEDAEQRVAVTPLVAQNEALVIEVVPGVHAHTAREPAAQRDLALRIEQGDLDPVDLGAVLADDRETGVHRRVDIARAPIAGELRIEHVAQPVEDHGAAHLPQHGPVDARVVVRPARRARQRPARHQDHTSPQAFHVSDLFRVRALHVGQRDAIGRRELVGARAAHDRAVPPGGARFGERAADQLARRGPIEPHAALGGVHRFRDPEPKGPQVAAVREGSVPIDARRGQRIRVGTRVGHDVGRRERHPTLDGARGRGPYHRFVRRVGLDRAVGARQANDRTG